MLNAGILNAQYSIHGDWQPWLSLDLSGRTD